jgi:hypothetical protein
MAWNPVSKQDTATIKDSIVLLQKTSLGYGNMTVTLLKNKMQQPHNDASDPNANTSHHCLRLYAYTDKSKLLVSAFFFLRRRKQKGKSDPKADWGGCLTVGAEDTGAAGGLTSDDLRDALNDVCKTVSPLAPNLEVMHLPPTPAFSPQNLKKVYDELRQNAQSLPMKLPRLEDSGQPIKLGYPWVPKDLNGNEVFFDFVRLKIVTKP